MKITCKEAYEIYKTARNFVDKENLLEIISFVEEIILKTANNGGGNVMIVFRNGPENKYNKAFFYEIFVKDNQYKSIAKKIFEFLKEDGFKTKIFEREHETEISIYWDKCEIK